MAIEVESRGLSFTPSRVQPLRARNGANGTTVARTALPFFIDSDAWSLDFGRTAAGHNLSPLHNSLHNADSLAEKSEVRSKHAVCESSGTELAEGGEEGQGGGDCGAGERYIFGLGGGAVTVGHGVPQQVLNLVAYVPLAGDRPLRILDEVNGRTDDAFTTPAWGGVAIVNDVPVRFLSTAVMLFS